MTIDIRRHYRFCPQQAVISRVVETAGLVCEVACLEPGQTVERPAGGAAGALCYVVEGTALFARGADQEYVSAGGLTAADRQTGWRLSNAGQTRLVVMMVSAPGCDRHKDDA